jgi:hypothetical protein
MHCLGHTRAAPTCRVVAYAAEIALFARPGVPFNATVWLRNYGFAAPVNARPVYFVMVPDGATAYVFCLRVCKALEFG